MTLKTPLTNYLYSFKYDYHHSELCKLETRQLFGSEVTDKVLFSDIKVDPSISPFLKNRFEIILSSNSYSELLLDIKKKDIRTHRFKVEYFNLEGDDAHFLERRKIEKEVGYSIEAMPDFKTPSVIYSICTYKQTWYFGVLIKPNVGWHKHKNKPCSFSNSISMIMAKALVNIASKGDKTIQLLDACCGVGTIMLEACFSEISVEGCDIHPKACVHARENLAHYGYTAQVHYSDIKDLHQKYDAAIIDLPYNLYSYSDEAITNNIIESTAQLASRIVIVSTLDIKPILKKVGLTISDSCTVEKRGKTKFKRNVWVCETQNTAN